MADDSKDQAKVSTEAKDGGASRKLRAVIDRIEDEKIAVLLVGDDEQHKIDVPLELLPDGASDGDHLRITFALDRESKSAAEDNVKALQERLLKRGKADDESTFKL